MKGIIILLTSLFAISCNNSSDETEISQVVRHQPKPVLVIHAGAGSIQPGQYTEQEEAQRDSALHEALSIGYSILNNNKTALEAVEEVIKYLEDCPYFNAGKGSVFNANGEVENDASIMDGSTLDAGAVAGIKNVKNPISLARLVKDSTKHVMLS